jgi:hypothetical protein
MWGPAYWIDLGERVASTAVYGAITLVTASSVQHLSSSLAWTIVGLPTALSLLKGLAANLSSPNTGAALLPTPPVAKP